MARTLRSCEPSVSDPDPDYGTVIAILDLATGEVDRARVDAGERRGGQHDGAPVWSPDGRHTPRSPATRSASRPQPRLLDTATFVVDVDGGNLRQLVDTALFARDAAWSPDGSTIAFTSAIAWLGVDQHSGKRENFNEDSDVYTVRADGSDLRRLTNFAPTRVDRGAPGSGRWSRERLDPRRAGSCSPCSSGQARAIRRICRPRSGSWTPMGRTRGSSMGRARQP